MDGWTLELGFHWPHDRCALGWEFMQPDNEHNYYTAKFYLLVVTITLDF